MYKSIVKLRLSLFSILRSLADISSLVGCNKRRRRVLTGINIRRPRSLSKNNKICCFGSGMHRCSHSVTDARRRGCKLGEDSFVEWKTHGIVLLDWCVKEALHSAVLANTLYDMPM
jgi:hypothetical protein